MNLPTEQEINPEGNSYDGQTAVTHFLGKTRERITQEWADHGHYYHEDLLYMGSQAFCFYLPAVVDYVTTAGGRDDNDSVSDLCRVIEGRLESSGPQIRQVFPDILRFADYALTHSQELGGFADDLFGDLRPRLEAIKRICAELAAQRDPALWKRRQVTQTHLEAACKLLPPTPGETPAASQRLLKQYRECIERAQLERALDTLQELGELLPCRGGYWRNLERAAESLDLVARIPHLRRRFEQTAKRADEP